MTAKLTTITAAAFALATTAAGAADLYVKAPSMPAPQTASGYIEMYTGWDRVKGDEGGSLSSEDDSMSGWALGGAGRGNYWFQPNMSVQLDAQGEGTSYKIPGSGGHASINSYLVGAHVTWRDPQNYALGIFGAGGDISGVRHGLIGGEGQIYWNQFTLYGQVGYDSTIGDVLSSGNSADAVFVRGTGRYFFTPNLMLEGTGLYANGGFDSSNGPSPDFDVWLWQAKLEWRPGTAPFSVFAKYQGSETKADYQGESFKVTDNRFTAGVRLYLGEGTLLSNDRKGATLDVIDVLGSSFGGLGIAGVSIGDAP